MTQQSTTSDLDVVRETDVPLESARAFALFTEQMEAFWPAEHSIGEAAFIKVVVEPTSGGRWYERDAQDRECPWGRVRTWDPPHRIGLVWQINARWEHDPALETYVDVDFEPIDGGTRVRLRHHGLEAYGDQAAELAALYASPQGWRTTLEGFVRASRDA